MGLSSVTHHISSFTFCLWCWSLPICYIYTKTESRCWVAPPLSPSNKPTWHFAKIDNRKRESANRNENALRKWRVITLNTGELVDKWPTVGKSALPPFKTMDTDRGFSEGKVGKTVVKKRWWYSRRTDFGKNPHIEGTLGRVLQHGKLKGLSAGSWSTLRKNMTVHQGREKVLSHCVTWRQALFKLFCICFLQRNKCFHF